MDESKALTIQIRLSPGERRRIDLRAAAVGLTRSDFIRSVTASETIPTRLFNMAGERLIAFRLSQIFDKLDALEGAANAYLSEVRVAIFVARLDLIRADVRRLIADAGRP